MSVPYPSCILSEQLIERGVNPLVALVAEFPFFIPFAMAYFFAGLQTWRLLVVIDMGRDALALALRRGDPAVWPIFTIFMLGWPLFLCVSWVAARLAPAPQPQQEL